MAMDAEAGVRMVEEVRSCVCGRPHVSFRGMETPHRASPCVFRPSQTGAVEGAEVVRHKLPRGHT